MNAASPFNRLIGVEVIAAAAGAATIACPAMPELLNHAGALHAGVQAALLDTAARYAAGTVAGNVVALHLSQSYLASAKGERFEARARVVKAGKAQLFVESELVTWRDGEEVRASSATAVLAKVG